MLPPWERYLNMRIFNEWGPIEKPSIGEAPCSPHVSGMCRGRHEDAHHAAVVANDFATQDRICGQCWKDHGGSISEGTPARGWVEGDQ